MYIHDIHEAVRLNKQESTTEFKGDAILVAALNYKERQENRKKAEEMLNAHTKQELIDFILSEV